MQKLTPKEAGMRSNERFIKQRRKKRDDKRLAKMTKLNKLLADQGRKPIYEEKCNGQSSKTRPPTENSKMFLLPQAPSNKASGVKSTASACSEG